MDIHFVEAGDPKGLPVVFIHGFPFSHAMWSAQLGSLGRGRRLIAYDLRGHGRTPPGDGLFTIEAFVDDLLRLLDFLRVERAVLCGLSMGGYVALRAVERAPERVRALILADTRAEADGNPAKGLRAAAMKAIAEKGMGPFAEEFAKNLFSPASAGKPCVEQITALMRANPTLGARGALLALASRMDATEWLARVKCPTLVVVGADDKLTPPALSESLAKAVPGAQLAVIPGAGHLTPVEQPEAFDRAVELFLSSVTP